MLPKSLPGRPDRKSRIGGGRPRIVLHICSGKHQARVVFSRLTVLHDRLGRSPRLHSNIGTALNAIDCQPGDGVEAMRPGGPVAVKLVDPSFLHTAVRSDLYLLASKKLFPDMAMSPKGLEVF